MPVTGYLFRCLALVFVSMVHAQASLSINMTMIGNSGNIADNTGYGAVNYTYQIGTYEVSVGQYTAFLNAKALSDPYGLYHVDMGGLGPGFGGPFILQTGISGSYTYSAVSGKENQPIRLVDFYDCIRFCNWLHNGQGDGDTENGAYNLSDGVWLEREPGATWVLPSEDEWYKAAYYDGINDVYFDYPNGSDVEPPEPTDENTPREMNFGDDPYWHGFGVCFTLAGETSGRSPYGTYDQGGNVTEWTDSMQPGQGAFRVVRGGSFLNLEELLRSSKRNGYQPGNEGDGFGFRIAYIIPEPGTILLLLLGLPFMFLFRRKKV